jgi:hypothetical protein
MLLLLLLLLLMLLYIAGGFRTVQLYASRLPKTI